MDWNCTVCSRINNCNSRFLWSGSSDSVGLPEEKTVLKTGGIYQFSRNPLYLGGFVMCPGSCVYSIHIIKLLMFTITFTIYYNILFNEEEFLDKRFGSSLLEYKKGYTDIWIKNNTTTNYITPPPTKKLVKLLSQRTAPLYVAISL